MDDLKLYATDRPHLDDLIKTTKRFSEDIGMDFGLDKCRTHAMMEGRWQHSEGYNDFGEVFIQGMDEYEHYKYLGCMQSIITDHKL